MKARAGIIVFSGILMSVILYNSNGSNAQEKTYNIGERSPAGGWIFYDKGNSSGGWRYLEAAPEDQGEAEWGCMRKSIPGATGTAIGTGKTNTDAIIKGCAKDKIAAKIAAAYRGGGKNDWFLPSKDELNAMYEKLHKAGLGGFLNDNFWSSSEGYDDLAWYQQFGPGFQYGVNKNIPIRFRAIRAF